MIQILALILLFFESVLLGPTYKHGSVGFPKSFNPLYAKSDSEKMISSLVFRGLFKYNDNQELVPDLAESYKIAEDGLSYEVKLKDTVKWHNGEPITANDVLYTASKSSVLREISTDKIDDKTVRFNLPNKFSPFLDLLTLGIVPTNSEDSSSLLMFGSGDFIVSRVKMDKSNIKEVFLITKNSSFQFRKIVFKFYENEGSLMSAYKLGEINGFLSKDRFVWDNISDFRVNFLGRHFVLSFNTKSKLLELAEDRKSLMEAIDYEKFFSTVINEKGIPANGPLSKTWAEDADLEFTKYEKAEEKDPDPEKVINFFYIAGAESARISQFIKNSWEKIGYTVNLQEIPAENLLANVRKHEDFDVLLLGEEVSRDPDRYVFWHSTQGDTGLNFGDYKAVRVDRALEEGRSALDRQERIKHYGIMQKVFVEDVPAIFLYHPTFHFYLSKQITGVNLTNIYYPWEIFKSFKDWTLKSE
ncbi:ABC transporter substrate-binding protein [Patescibacteria group bacterium]|nr:ABC transporter substrate-binding protein [Patescibacteria group bacterium]